MSSIQLVEEKTPVKSPPNGKTKGKEFCYN